MVRTQGGMPMSRETPQGVEVFAVIATDTVDWNEHSMGRTPEG